MTDQQLWDFLFESNKIEGIEGVKRHEIVAAEKFLALNELAINDLEEIVAQFQPRAILRDLPGLDVRVGNYIAPRGGSAVRAELELILIYANKMQLDPYQAHIRYETLHPFTDGNGRSGRMLWLWMHKQRGRNCPLGFLHHFYYEALSHSENR